MVESLKKENIKNKSEINAKISSQNEDTGIASYSPKNSASFEQKNMPKGCRCRTTTGDK
jgi:hypothetical protein